MTVALPEKSKIENQKSKMIFPLSALLAGTLAFLAIAADLHFHGLLHQADDPLRAFFHFHSQPLLIILCSGLSFLGEFSVLFPIAFFVAGYLLALRRRAHTVIWIIALLGSVGMNESLKHYFKVPRPTRFTYYVWDTTKNPGYSFPSGHTMGVAITVGAAYLIARHLRLIPHRYFKRITAAALALPLAVAFSLLYVGVHSLTDVLAALALATAWLGVIALLLTRVPCPPILNPEL
ncbi:MAG: phosphatase PAP2 family protein [Phycisphaerae bacterium]